MRSVRGVNSIERDMPWPRTGAARSRAGLEPAQCRGMRAPHLIRSERPCHAFPVLRLSHRAEILFGRGTARKTAGRAASLGRCVVLIHGASADRAAWLKADLSGRGLTVVPFSGPSEPDIAFAEAAVTATRAAGAEVIVALVGMP